MSNPSVTCPAVFGQIKDFGVETPTKYQACTGLPLRQFWRGPQTLPAESGHARVGAAPQGLSFYVYLEDSDIFSTATADNQRLWTLGDVAEFFVKPGTQRSDYWEIHLTPNNFIMDIHIPDRNRFMDGTVSWDQVIAPQSNAEKQVKVLENKWAVELCIPWSSFGQKAAPAPGTVWQFAVCRYNYNGDLEQPEHSSTAHFTELGFHRFEEFTDLVFD